MNEQITFDPQIATLVEVANLYYKESFSQQEIAERLQVSRSLIALYLSKAREQGIVQIEVINPQHNVDLLAKTLQERAQIQHAIVVPHGHRSSELTRRAIAGAAAKYLENQLKNGDVLGLVWGRTITQMIDLLAPTHPIEVDVVPLLGESSFTNTYTQMNQLVLQTAEHFNGRPHFLLAPMQVSSKSLRDALLKDPHIREVTDHWDHLDLACFGVGVLPPDPGQIPYVGEPHISRMLERGAVGDLCGIHHFDIEGNIIPSSLVDETIGVSLDQLSQTDHRIAVASGKEKMRGVLGALRSGLVTTIIIDAELSQAVLAAL